MSQNRNMWSKNIRLVKESPKHRGDYWVICKNFNMLLPDQTIQIRKNIMVP